jgi:hypothetical protein
MVPWSNVHSTKTRVIDGEKISTDSWAEFDSVTTIKELKLIVKTILKGK